MDKSKMLSNLDKAWQKQESEAEKQNEQRAKQITNALWKSLEAELKPVRKGLRSYIYQKMAWASVITIITLILLILWSWMYWNAHQIQKRITYLEKAQENLEVLTEWQGLGEVEIHTQYGDYLVISSPNKKAEVRNEDRYGKSLLIPKKGQ